MKFIFNLILITFSVIQLSCQNNGSSDNSETINRSIDVDAFEKKLSDSVQLIDVRSPEEFEQGHLKGALNYNINADEFENQLSNLDKNKPTLVYCLSGGRSGSAADIMADKGFKEVYNMQGGTMKWNGANKPMDTGAAPLKSNGMTEANFKDLLKSDKYVLVDYNAKWCKPCIKMAPMLEAFTNKRKEKVMLVKIDADENKNLLKQNGVESLPVLELYKNGELIWKHVGEIDEATLIHEIKL